MAQFSDIFGTPKWLNGWIGVWIARWSAEGMLMMSLIGGAYARVNILASRVYRTVNFHPEGAASLKSRNRVRLQKQLWLRSSER